MSEVIVQMELPKLCFECFFRLDCELYMNELMKPFEKRDFTAFKPLGNGCLIRGVLPDEHGRLIDAEMLKAKKYHSYITNENAVAVAEIDWAETIVPATYEER